MNYFIKNSLLISSLLCTSAFSLNASAADNIFKITDFRFALNDASFGSWETGQGAQNMDPSLYGNLVTGSYQGNNSTSVLINFDFFGGPVNNYTRASNEGTDASPAGTIPGGPAPSIDLINLTADMSSWFAQWNGTDFNQGNNTNWDACIDNIIYDQLSDVATVTDNLDGTYRVNWNSCITGGTFNSQIGYWQLDLTCITCASTTLGPADTLTASQNGGATTTQTVINTVGGGNVTITSSLVGTAGVIFTWTSSDVNITDTDSNLTNGSFTFDPEGLTAGNYVFTATYQDTNTQPDDTKGTGEIVIRVVDSAVGDTGDSNGNGIQNKDDAGLANSQLQSVLGANSSTYVLETSSGSLRLGKTAFCAGTAAKLTSAELEANAGDACETTINSSDDLIKTVGIGGYYDFEVTGLTMGETVDIAIPLTASIPNSAVYRKYNTLIGWSTFTSDDNNSLSSANAISEGMCPAPSSTDYTAGLTAGHNCLRLTITDGGPNDTDNSVNGLIKDPGAIAEINSNTEPSLSGGCSISGKPASLNHHSEWLLIFAALTWLGLSRARTKQQLNNKK